MLPINPFRWTSPLASGNRKRTAAIDALLARLEDFGTFAVYAPYYDSSRTSTGTYDLNGSGVKMDLTGAVFDSANHNAAKFDGVDDTAATDGTYSSTSCAGYILLCVAESTEDRAEKYVGWNDGGWGQSPTDMQRAGGGHTTYYQYHTDASLNVKESSLEVASGTHILSTCWNGTNIKINVDGVDGSVVAAADIANKDSALRISGNVFFYGAMHLILFNPTATPTQVNAFCAAQSEINALIKSAISWLTLP